jgi:accessory gene regulator B
VIPVIVWLSEKTADALIGSGAVNAQDRDIYVYGMDVLLSTAANTVGILALGFLIGRWAETLLYMAFFTTLRSAAGGYHASTHFRCFLIMLASYSAAMALVVLLPSDISRLAALPITLLAFAIVGMLAPVPHSNRPVGAREYSKFKKLSLAIAIVETVIVGIFVWIDAPALAIAGALGMLTSAFSLSAAVMLGRKHTF